MTRAIAILAAILAAGTALAATRTVTVSASGQGTAALTKFDTSLGTLQSATIQATYSSTVGFMAYGGVPAGYDHAVTGVFTLGNLAFALAGTTTTTSYAPFGSFTVAGSGSTSFTAANDLAALLGGSLWLGASAYAPPPGTLVGGSYLPTVSYDLTYAYDDGRAAVSLAAGASPNVAPVPEPASWIMMIGGFGLVGGALRAGRRRAVPA